MDLPLIKMGEGCQRTDFRGQGIKNSSFLSLIYQLDIEGQTEWFNMQV